MNIWESISKPDLGQISIRLFRSMSFGNWSWIKECDGGVGIALELSNEHDISLLTSTKYFSIKNREVPGLGYILTVICQDAEFYDIFEVLCNDLVESSYEAKNQAEAISLLNQRLDAWTLLFKNYRGMGRREIYGLAAELSFLREWLELGQSINDWTGPNGASQDFINKKINKAVEVKATSSDMMAVKISSLEQLDFGGALYLCVYPINNCESSNPKAITIARLIKELKESMSDIDIVTLQKKLVLVGYISNEVEIEKYSFSIGEPVYYEVSTGFPRLIKANTALEISNCHYDINLNKCKKFLTNSKQIFSEFKQ